jgi:HEAT repeat protein
MTMIHDETPVSYPSSYSSIVCVLADRFDNPCPDVRIRAARAVADATTARKMVRHLVDGLGDKDPTVAEAMSEALHRVVTAHPDLVDKVVRRIHDPDLEVCLPLARFLVRLGTDEALEGAIAALPELGPGEDRGALLELLAGAQGLPDARFEAVLDGEHDQNREWAADILARRGVERGYHTVFEEYDCAKLVDRVLADGAEGIRTLCRMIPTWAFDVVPRVATRIAAQGDPAVEIVYEIAADPTSGGDRIAIQVLGQWDEPRSVDTLLRIAGDKRREADVRDEARDALCTLHAPEAIDLLGRALLDAEIPESDRAYYAYVLGEIGNTAALEPLAVAVTRDPQSRVAPNAWCAIERIEGDPEDDALERRAWRALCDTRVDSHE